VTNLTWNGSDIKVGDTVYLHAGLGYANDCQSSPVTVTAVLKTVIHVKSPHILPWMSLRFDRQTGKILSRMWRYHAARLYLYDDAAMEYDQNYPDRARYRAYLENRLKKRGGER